MSQPLQTQLASFCGGFLNVQDSKIVTHRLYTTPAIVGGIVTELKFKFWLNTVCLTL